MFFKKNRKQKEKRPFLEKFSGIDAVSYSFGFFVLISVLFVFLFNVTAVRAEQNQENGEYFFGAGDLLDIRVFGEPEVSSQVVVRIDGRISLPLAGELRAAGNTPEALSNNIRERLERYIESPAVTVMLVESRSKTYYIIGQIQEPGEYSINRTVSVLQAIARAGGFLEWAKKDRIMIVGEAGAAEKITYFDYDQFLRRADSRKNVLISPGDTIVIP